MSYRWLEKPCKENRKTAELTRYSDHSSIERSALLTHQGKPALSVILATPNCYETIRNTIKHLQQQTVRHLLEIVIVTPSRNVLNANESELGWFPWVQIVEVGSVTSIGSANAKGVRKARASIVALAEDHAFPTPGWAEALIAAHQHPWAAVGPVFLNPNDSKNIIAWADFLTGVGEYIAPRESAVVQRLPGNNSSYKRALLLEFEPHLETMMETETFIHRDLIKKGHQLYLESQAQVFHLNFEKIVAFFSIKYLSGRIFGSVRAREWSLLFRLFFACGTPLIPLVRYRRYKKRWKDFRQHQKLPWGAIPMAWCGLAVSATGEMIGCCFGPGRAVAKREKLEFHRETYLKNPHQPIETDKRMVL